MTYNTTKKNECSMDNFVIITTNDRKNNNISKKLKYLLTSYCEQLYIVNV